MLKRIACVIAAAALVASPAIAKERCFAKAGSGWGVTLGIAKFQSYEIIQQTTGNWPIESDHISKPVYKCKGSGLSYSCVAHVTVCKKA
jgi:hypothetical protein